MLRILFPDARFEGEADIETEALKAYPKLKVAFEVYYETAVQKGRPTVPDVSLAACDALIVYHKAIVDDVLLARAPNCRIIVRAGVGFDNIDLVACGARGIPVCNVPDYGTTEIADHAIAMMLTLVRGTSWYDRALRHDPVAGWTYEGAPTVRRIRGATFGVVGFGRIGNAVAQRARSFEMNIAFFDPLLPEDAPVARAAIEAGWRRFTLIEELVSFCDVISLHLPLNEATLHLVSKELVAAMKPGAILINTARGAIVDTSAVYQGLRTGRLSAAALDVLSIEPPSSRDPLVSAWLSDESWIRGRLLLTPHAAFYSAAGYRDMRRKSAETALSFLATGQLTNCVNAFHLKGFGA